MLASQNTCLLNCTNRPLHGTHDYYNQRITNMSSNTLEKCHERRSHCLRRVKEQFLSPAQLQMWLFNWVTQFLCMIRLLHFWKKTQISQYITVNTKLPYCRTLLAYQLRSQMSTMSACRWGNLLNNTDTETLLQRKYCIRDNPSLHVTPLGVSLFCATKFVALRLLYRPIGHA